MGLVKKTLLTQGPQPSLNLNFLSGVLDPRITFTRAANTATFFGSNLLLQTANANIPRFDFNPLTGGCRGLLIEQASTNVAIQNRDLTNAAWTKVTATAALDQIGIDGATNSASSLTATLGNGTCLQTVVHVSSTDTYSVYIKRITGTGEIDISTDGGTWTNITAQLSTTAWTRVSVTQATVVNPVCGIRIVTNGDKIAVDYSQLEVLGFATSPILTTTVAVARNADVATMATSAFGLSNTQGTFLTQYQRSGTNLNVVLVAGAGNYNWLGIDGAHSIFGFDDPNGHFNSYGANAAIGNSTVTKSVAAYDATSFNLTASGLPVKSFSWTNVAQTNIGLGVNTSGNNYWINGWLQQVKYWPQRLPNQQLIQMTR